MPYWSAGVVVLALLIAVNIKGTEETGLFQIVVTVVKVALLALFLYGGLQAIDTQVLAQSFTENIGRFREIGLTSALVFITFFGFEAIATNAEEIENPGRNVPRAIFISMGVVTVIYILVVVVIVLAVNDSAFLGFLRGNADLGGLAPVQFVKENGEIAMGRAAQYYLGSFGFYVIVAGALFSMLSAANATILAGSRVKLAMARRRHLPERFEDLHPSLNTPWKAVLLTGGLILFYIVVFSVLLGGVPGQESHGPPLGLAALEGVHLGIEALAHFADFMLLLGLVAVNLALIQSRRKHPDLERGFRMPGVPWLPAFAILATLALLINVEPAALVLGAVAELVGVAFWFAWKREAAPAEERAGAVGPTVLSDFAMQAGEHDYQLVVPVASEEQVEPLMRTAATLAHARGGELLVVSVVTVPRQTPFSYANAHRRRPLLTKALEQARAAGVPASGVVRIGHRADEAILDTVRRHKSQGVLIGWQGRRSPTEASGPVLGPTLDRVIEEAPCEIFVKKIAQLRPEDPSSILLPVGGGPHGELATRTATDLARESGATVRLVRVLAPGASDAEREQAEGFLREAAEHMREEAGERAFRIEPDLLEGQNVAATIAREASGHGLVVVGARRAGLREELLFGDLTEEVSARLPQVLMVKTPERAGSRLKQSLRRLFR